MINFEDMFKDIDFDKLAEDTYNMKKEGVTKFSYWYPKIKNCGIPTPNSKVREFNFDEYQLIRKFLLDGEGSDDAKTMNKIHDILMPTWYEAKRDFGKVFIKTGTFSNKFDFKTAITQEGVGNIMDAMFNVLYGDMMVEAGGDIELVYRELIPADKDIPTIYEGMPLRPEYRVFYDFDKKKLVYVAEYWEYETMVGGLYNEDDLKTYKEYYPKLHEKYNKYLEEVIELSNNHLPKATGLKGSWSVDFMVDERDGKYKVWLIDMAPAHRSAYFDPAKFE